MAIHKFSLLTIYKMTKEDYEYLKSKCNLPSALFSYTIQEDDIVKIGKGSLIMSVRGDRDEENIKKMTEIESTPGFMFWHGSKESEEFRDKNKEAIADFFTRALLA